MRREWSGWIRMRQWAEFEKLAKTDPSQGLADTVAELELGFPDKPDRKALRKILFLLSQAGYEPREIEDHTSEAEQPAPPIAKAFMASPSDLGDTAITLILEERGRASWLLADLSFAKGVTQASEENIPLDLVPEMIQRMQNTVRRPGILAEIPLSFALNRLAQSVAITKNIPSVMAYWRARLPAQFSKTHHAEELPRTHLALQDLDEAIRSLTPVTFWRMELGSLAPTLEEFYNAQQRADASSEPKNHEWWYKVLAPSREQLFTTNVIDDHRNRLLDLAYVMHVKGDPDFGAALALADDLRDLGPHSVYAKWMATKTLVLLFEILKKQNATERSNDANGAQP